MMKFATFLATASASLVPPASPACAEFVQAMVDKDFGLAEAMSGGSAELNADAASDLGEKALPFAALVHWTKGCEISPALSRQHDEFYDLWWNCGTETRSDGQLWRKTVRVFVFENNFNVVLKNMMKANFPDSTSSPALRQERGAI